MRRNTAPESSAVWTSVGQQPFDSAVQQMINEGWRISSYGPEQSHVIMKRGEHTATLHRNTGEVGMAVVGSTPKVIGQDSN
ncbi:MAG TPA: hypothetical protein VGP72_00990 [Planctomycetota bacterium]